MGPRVVGIIAIQGCSGVVEPYGFGFLNGLRLFTEEGCMLWTVCLALFALWLLGIVSAYTFGGFIHILLWAAVAVVLMRVIQNRASTD